MRIVHEDRGKFPLLMGMFFVDFYDLPILYFSSLVQRRHLFMLVTVLSAPLFKVLYEWHDYVKALLLTPLKRNRHKTSYDSFNRTSLRDVS